MEEFVSNLDALHHIQQTVLRQLTYKKWVSYSELLPDGMAGNAFNYHLNYLVKHRLIAKDEQGYTLTPLGRLVIDAMSLNAKRFKLRPSSGVMLYLTDPTEKFVLLYESKRQPLIGHIGLPFWKLKVGESFTDTVHRMVVRRGFDPGRVTDLQYFAPLNIRYKEVDDLVCQRTGQVWYGVYKGELETVETDNGRAFWESLGAKVANEAQLAADSKLNDATIDIVG